MEDVEDDLDLRFHKGLAPDVYYRCPTLEVQPLLSQMNAAKSWQSSLWREPCAMSGRRVHPP